MNPLTSSHTFPASTRHSPEKSLRIQGLDGVRWTLWRGVGGGHQARDRVNAGFVLMQFREAGIAGLRFNLLVTGRPPTCVTTGVSSQNLVASEAIGNSSALTHAGSFYAGLAARSSAGQALAEEHVAPNDGLDSFQQLGSSQRLENVASGAGGERGLNDLPIRFISDNQDFRRGIKRTDLTGGFQTVQPRHPQIHQDEVGLQRARIIYRVAPVGSGADGF